MRWLHAGPIHHCCLLRRPASPRASFLRRLAHISLGSRLDPPDPALPRKLQTDKNLLKARDSVKELAGSSSVHFASSAFLLPNQADGFVAAAQANFMRIIVESVGGNLELSPPHKVGMELLCVVRAVLKKIKRRVLVGDQVLVGSVDWVDRRGMIEDVFPRGSEISDPPVANVDHLLVVFSMEEPKLEPFLLTRFSVEAESTGIPVTLALNKVELGDEETLLAWRTRIRSWGYEPVFSSVESKYGLPSLTYFLRGQTTVIMGPSGVGKSSLINALRSDDRYKVASEVDTTVDLFQAEVSKWFEDQRVGQVSMRNGWGKHTTRHVSLLPLVDGGYLADTPGFNQPSLLKVTKRSLANMFPEVSKVLSASEPAKCSFNDFLHLGEPGCLMKGDWERYPYYLQLLDEIKIREEFQIRTLGTKRESDERYKMGEMGVKQAEP